MADIELSCVEFTEKLASKSPTPGGGGAAALVGATGAALLSMVGNLTIGKKKYADVERDISNLTEKVNKYRIKFLDLVEGDANAFAPLSKAYSLPNGTPEERAYKDKIMEECLYEACCVPIDIMEACCKLIELVDTFAEKGSRLAISDAACAALLLKSSLQCASLNVYINTKSMKDRTHAEKLNDYADAMLIKYEPLADEIYKKIKASLNTKNNAAEGL